MSRKTLQSALELRLTDLRGHVLDSATPTFGSLGGMTKAVWTPSRRKLVVVARREVGGTVYDVFSLDITRSAIGRRVSPVLAGIELRDDVFHLTPDGERFLYYTGPVESELSTIDVNRASANPFAAHHVLSSTTPVRGRLSPVADRILLARDIPRDYGRASQFSVIGRTGGEESPVVGPPVENLLDFDWSPDGARIIYLHGIGGGQVRLTERDTTGRSTREIKQLTDSEAIIFHPLADGGVSIVATDRHALSVINRPGKRDTTWLIPNWMSVIAHVGRSPDGKSLAVTARSITLDTIVVAKVDLETGNFTRLAAYPGEDARAVTWVKDGRIMFIFRGPDGAFALYRISPGRPAEKVSALPYYRAEFSVSNDGRHVAAFGYNDKNDVYMIRNFGELLRQ